MKYILITAYVVIVALPGLWWWQNNQSITLYTIGQLAALTGFPMLVMQLLLAARFHWIERWFGQDRIMRFHRKTGLIAFTLLVFHPIAFSTSLYMVDPALVWPFLSPRLNWQLLGQIALDTLFLIVILSIWTAIFKLPYHWWKRIHSLTYIVLAAGFVHSLKLGSDLIPLDYLRYYWYGLGSAALFAFLQHRIIAPLWARTRPYTIQAIRQEAKGVRTIILESTSQRRMQYKPGQFLFIKFIHPNVTGEWHPFTISSSPTEKYLSISAKASGDWTNTLGVLMPGNTAYIQAPFGRFSFTNLSNKRDIVFIAGGIGITPFRSALQYVVDKNITERSFQLLYSNRTRHDVSFREELDNMFTQAKNISITHILSQDETWPGEKGRVDEVCIKKHVSNIAAKEYFICGPPPMMAAIKDTLRKLGVPKQQIHTEEFSLK